MLNTRSTLIITASQTTITTLQTSKQAACVPQPEYHNALLPVAQLFINYTMQSYLAANATKSAI